MVDVKETLSSKVVTKKESKEDEDLTERKRHEKLESGTGKKKRSKYSPNNLKYSQCHKEIHFKKDCCERKNKYKDLNEKSGDTDTTIASKV